MKVFTIGFTQKSAERFFGLLQEAKVERVVDIRLNNSSQLAGFAKRDDLEYFLRELAGIGYVHEPLLAPTQQIFNDYRKKAIDQDTFERQFTALLQEREVEKHLDPALLDGGCLLCSEAEPEQCHRRLVLEYLQEHWCDLEIKHLI